MHVQVTHDASKSYSDCLAVSFGTGHYSKQCHAFQAKSSREVREKGVESVGGASQAEGEHSNEQLLDGKGSEVCPLSLSWRVLSEVPLYVRTCTYVRTCVCMCILKFQRIPTYQDTLCMAMVTSVLMKIRF